MLFNRLDIIGNRVRNFVSKMMIVVWFGIILISSCSVSPEKIKINEKNELVLIEQVIRNSIGWAKNKDFGLLYSVIANDSNYLEVDPENRVVRGISQFRKAEPFWSNPDFKAIRYEIRDLTINLSRSDDVAWYYCILDDINEWKGQPASWINTRWTGVLEKREGRWVIVQMHFSFAKE